MDENGNGEPPSCCGQPFDTDMLREARAAVSELIEKAEALATAVAEETEYFATHKHLDEASFFENRVVQCTDELRAALARVQGGQL